MRVSRSPNARGEKEERETRGDGHRGTTKPSMPRSTGWRTSRARRARRRGRRGAARRADAHCAAARRARGGAEMAHAAGAGTSSPDSSFGGALLAVRRAEERTLNSLATAATAENDFGNGAQMPARADGNVDARRSERVRRVFRRASPTLAATAAAEAARRLLGERRRRVRL